MENLGILILIATLFSGLLVTINIMLFVTLYRTKYKLKTTQIQLDDMIKKNRELSLILYPPLAKRSIIQAKMVGQNTCVTDDGIERTMVLTERYWENAEYCYIRYFKELAVRKIKGYVSEIGLVILTNVNALDYKVYLVDEIYPASVSSDISGYVEGDKFYVVDVDIVGETLETVETEGDEVD